MSLRVIPNLPKFPTLPNLSNFTFHLLLFIFALSSFHFNILGVDNPIMRVGGDNLLSDSFCAEAEEEKSARHTVDNLVKGVDGCYLATNAILLYLTPDHSPAVAPLKVLNSSGLWHTIGKSLSVAYNRGDNLILSLYDGGCQCLYAANP